VHSTGRRHVRLLLTVLVALPLLTGCGSASDAKSVTKAEYVAQGQPICREARAQLAAFSKQLKVKPRPSAAVVSKGSRKTARAFRAAVRRLALVPVPSRLSVASADLSRAVLDQARLLEGLATGIDRTVQTHDPRPARRAAARLRKSNSDKRADRAARRTGLTACGGRN
jgi:hypothetical protein